MSKRKSDQRIWKVTNLMSNFSLYKKKTKQLVLSSFDNGMGRQTFLSLYIWKQTTETFSQVNLATSTNTFLEKEMATHSSILAWKTPWTKDPGRLQSMGSQRVGHNWAISLSLYTLCIHGRDPGHWVVKVAQSCPTLYDPMDYTVHGILQAKILKWVVVPSPGDLPNPGIKPRSPTLQEGSLPAEPPGKPKNSGVG